MQHNNTEIKISTLYFCFSESATSPTVSLIHQSYAIQFNKERTEKYKISYRCCCRSILALHISSCTIPGNWHETWKYTNTEKKNRIKKYNETIYACSEFNYNHLNSDNNTNNNINLCNKMCVDGGLVAFAHRQGYVRPRLTCDVCRRLTLLRANFIM